MVMTDPIADMLTRIRNANQMRNEVVEMPSSKIKVGDIDQDVTITSLILNIIDDERQNITIIEQ